MPREIGEKHGRLILSWGWRKHIFSPRQKWRGNKQAQNGGGHIFAGPRFSWYPDFCMVGSVGKGCSEVNRAYIAGLFDCDGAIMAWIESHKEKKFGFRVRVCLQLTQKYPHLLQWVQSVLGVGAIRPNRTTYDWELKDQGQCQELLLLLQPYMKGKAKQITLALQILSMTVQTKEDLITVAQLADTLSGFNVRSFGRRKNYTSKIQEHLSSND
ncbi:LAGLIDADG family homing endonuclease [Candidatus Roizmanbacteria bacterium]|nr:LAGLIDADG family homing endonuclease [Candidatus Roizmanbacteria bacterium]